MKTVVSILLLFIIMVRSYLPLIDYAINYHYISTQLCENKDNPELLCNGKCYLKKELSKTNQNRNQPIEIKLQSIDVFVINENNCLSMINKLIETNPKIDHQCLFKPQKYSQEIFHPPLV